MTKTVADVMTPNPIAVKPQTPLKEAIKILAEKKIGGLPVVDEGGKISRRSLRNGLDVAGSRSRPSALLYDPR